MECRAVGPTVHETDRIRLQDWGECRGCIMSAGAAAHGERACSGSTSVCNALLYLRHFVNNLRICSVEAESPQLSIEESLIVGGVFKELEGYKHERQSVSGGIPLHRHTHTHPRSLSPCPVALLCDCRSCTPISDGMAPAVLVVVGSVRSEAGCPSRSPSSSRPGSLDHGCCSLTDAR